MRHTTSLLAVSLLLTAAGAAQTTDLDVNPGLIGADSPLYGLDRALDDVLKPPGERAHERASEALIAAEANQTQARDRALTALNQTLTEANGLRDADGLAQTAALLTEIKDQTPAAAQDGIETALDQVVAAQNRFPTDTTPPAESDGADTGPGRGGWR